MQKQRLRKLYFLGLVAALDSIATGSAITTEATIRTTTGTNRVPNSGETTRNAEIRSMAKIIRASASMMPAKPTPGRMLPRSSEVIGLP